MFTRGNRYVSLNLEEREYIFVWESTTEHKKCLVSIIFKIISFLSEILLSSDIFLGRSHWVCFHFHFQILLAKVDIAIKLNDETKNKSMKLNFLGKPSRLKERMRQAPLLFLSDPGLPRILYTSELSQINDVHNPFLHLIILSICSPRFLYNMASLHYHNCS